MKLKTFTAFLSSKETFKIEERIMFKEDGYMSALVEASKQCREKYPHLYVAKVEQLQ